MWQWQYSLACGKRQPSKPTTAMKGNWQY